MKKVIITLLAAISITATADVPARDASSPITDRLDKIVDLLRDLNRKVDDSGPGHGFGGHGGHGNDDNEPGLKMGTYTKPKASYYDSSATTMIVVKGKWISFSSQTYGTCQFQCANPFVCLPADQSSKCTKLEITAENKFRLTYNNEVSDWSFSQ